MRLSLLLLTVLMSVPSFSVKTSSPATSKASNSGQTSDPGITETLSLSLTSKDSETTIRITKIVVEETKAGKTEEYVIDMLERKVFLGNNHKSLNDLEVFDNTKEEKFEIEKGECGAVIDKPCGLIELPANYQPGLDCTWTIPVKNGKKAEYKFDIFELGEGDQIAIDGIQVESKPSKPKTVQKTIEVSFKSELTSKRKSKMKISFEEPNKEKSSAQKTPISKDPNSKCKDFWFGKEAAGYPANMKDDVGEGIFMFARTKMLSGKTTSVYYNKETDITIEQMASKYKSKGNYWKIGDQAWQMFTHKEDSKETQKITEESCPTDLSGWNFKGNYMKDMKAIEISQEEAEKQGICLPKDYWKQGNSNGTIRKE